MRITRRLRRQIAEHKRMFAELPVTTVPSALISDEQTSAWSREMYAADLDFAKIGLHPYAEQFVARDFRRKPFLRFVTALIGGVLR